MSLAVLPEVYSEARRLAIAGSVVGCGDFRLKKLVPPLQKSGEKAPIFAKVAGAVEALVNSDEKGSAAALLDLCSLIASILYTQGETGCAGEIEPIEPIHLSGPRTQASARALKPLLEALSSKGSGRLEIIKDAFERGLFNDLRLVQPSLDAIDDVYPEIGDFIADTVLPLFGKAILPPIRAKYDVKGRGGHVRRLKLMHRLDPAGSRDTVLQALESGSKEMKVAAIGRLGDAPEDLGFLLEQARAKAKDVRIAAVEALHGLNAPEAITAVCKALSGPDVEQLWMAIHIHAQPETTNFLVAEARKGIESLLTAKGKKAIEESASRVIWLIQCLSDAPIPGVDDFLVEAFSGRDKLEKAQADRGGADVVELLAVKMATFSSKTADALIEAADTLYGSPFQNAFFAACSSRTPDQVFGLFSRYFQDKRASGRKRGIEQSRSDLLADALRGNRHGGSWRLQRYGYQGSAPTPTPDPRWLDLAIDRKDLDLVSCLMIRGHANAEAFVEQAFEDEMKKAKDFNVEVLDALVSSRHPKAVDATIRMLSKYCRKGDNTGRHGGYYLRMLIPKLPKDAVEKLEALFLELDQDVVKYLIDPVNELKNQPS